MWSSFGGPPRKVGPIALDLSPGAPQPACHHGVFVGESAAMHGMYRMLLKVARSETTCLITGESGTGKELAADVIHRLSGRGNGPFVPVNCGAIPENLLESEFFGHKKGAFTGAVADHRGRFVLANAGTLFLDEIGEMQPSLQVKLLRALQAREVTPVGGTKAERLDVRVVAATNRDLQTEMGAGRFREDLYYRLAVVPLRMPPLRERPEDVPLLIRAVAARLNDGNPTPIRGITQPAIDALRAWSWPGNVRELCAVLERMFVLADADVLDIDDVPAIIREAGPPPAPVPEQEPFPSVPEVQEGEQSLADVADGVATIDLPPASPAAADHIVAHTFLGLDPRLEPVLPEDGIALSEAVDRFETALILQALRRTGWNKNQAARLLQLNRTTLVEKLKKRNLLAPRGEGGAESEEAAR